MPYLCSVCLCPYAPGHMRPFGINTKKSKADCSRHTPKNMALKLPIKTFPENTPSDVQCKLGKVTDFGDPNLNIE